jgi:hypothetical protein
MARVRVLERLKSPMWLHGLSWICVATATLVVVFSKGSFSVDTLLTQVALGGCMGAIVGLAVCYLRYGIQSEKEYGGLIWPAISIGCGLGGMSAFAPVGGTGKLAYFLVCLPMLACILAAMIAVFRRGR